MTAGVQEAEKGKYIMYRIAFFLISMVFTSNMYASCYSGGESKVDLNKTQITKLRLYVKKYKHRELLAFSKMSDDGFNFFFNSGASHRKYISNFKSILVHSNGVWEGVPFDSINHEKIKINGNIIKGGIKDHHYIKFLLNIELPVDPVYINTKNQPWVNPSEYELCDNFLWEEKLSLVIISAKELSEIPVTRILRGLDEVAIDYCSEFGCERPEHIHENRLYRLIQENLESSLYDELIKNPAATFSSNPLLNDYFKEQKANNKINDNVVSYDFGDYLDDTLEIQNELIKGGKLPSYGNDYGSMVLPAGKDRNFYLHMPGVKLKGQMNNNEILELLRNKKVKKYFETPKGQYLLPHSNFMGGATN